MRPTTASAVTRTPMTWPVRAVLARLLHHDRPAARPRRPCRAAGDHHAAPPHARHPGRPHLDPQVHLSRRPDPVPAGDHRRAAHPNRPAGHRRLPDGAALRPHAARVARAVQRRRRRGVRTRLRPGVPAHVGPVPGLLRGRLPRRVPRCPPARTGTERAVTVSVMVFTRDLRLADNPALTAAARADAVVPLFVWDQQILGMTGGNASRLGFLLDSLRDLDASLREAGAALVSRTGPWAKTVIETARSAGQPASIWPRTCRA